MSRTATQTKWLLASVALHDAFTDFMLSRQAMNCTPATLAFYKYTAGFFLAWAEARNVNSPADVNARHVREYLAQLAAGGKKDTTLHDHARAIKTLLRFWHNENYIPAPVTFDMPRLASKRLPVLTAEQVQELVKACDVRDRALVLFMVDSGLRRAEVCKLNWDDIDFASGLVRVKQGKGRKDRSAVIGAKTRRALLAYRRTLSDTRGAVFNVTPAGMTSIFRRMKKRTGINVSPHALRRTFVILSLRAGMDAMHLKALLGHADYSMVERYAQLEDIDLAEEHAKHSPVDSL